MNVNQFSLMDGRNLYYLFLAGSRRILDNQTELNKINVYPVPDADTGSNFASTIRTIIENTRPQASYKATADSIASAALLGARGNSGVIFAQFLYGMSNETADVEQINVEGFAESIKRSVAYIYEAIQKPVEGTMLTVIRDWAEFIYQNKERFDDFRKLLAASLVIAQESLIKTALRIKELTKINVVDAGAKGFVLFLEGILEFIRTGDIRMLLGMNRIAVEELPLDMADHDSLTFRFCTEALIKGENLDRKKLRDLANDFGDSMVIAGSTKTLRLHIHTDEPQKLFEKLRDFGTLTFQKADDMYKQYEVAHKRKWKIALVTDSSCDLPPHLIDHYQIHVVPMNLYFGDNHYLDKVTIHPEQFYRLLELENAHPKSAQPNEKTFENLYSHLSSHYDSVIALHLPGSLSGTYKNSCFSAEKISRESGKKISVIDTRQISGSLGLVALRFAKAIESGMSHDEVVKHAGEWIEKTRLLVSVKTLKYLVLGGRVSKMKGFFANLLNMKPILALDKTGKTYLMEKTFSMKANMKSVLRKIQKEGKSGEITDYIILHAHSEDDARWFAEQMVELSGIDPLAVVEISPVIGVHSGPGTIAIAFMLN
jgi:uncharacterized protein